MVPFSLLLLWHGTAGIPRPPGRMDLAQGRSIDVDRVVPAAGVVPDAHGPVSGSSSLSDGTFYVRFNVEATTGPESFIVEVDPSWAPVGAARFRTLVASDFFSQCRFFRVIDGFVAQFGISGLPLVTEAVFRGLGDFGGPIRDDKVPSLLSNRRGTFTFAMADRPDTRLTQLFFNLRDNLQFDTAFAPIGRVIEGIEALDMIQATGEGLPHGPGPEQKRIRVEGNEYLEREFPELSYIHSATIIPRPSHASSSNLGSDGQSSPPPVFMSPPPFAKPDGAFYDDLLRGQPGLKNVQSMQRNERRMPPGEFQGSRDQALTPEDEPVVMSAPKLSIQPAQPLPATRAAASRGVTSFEELAAAVEQHQGESHGNRESGGGGSGGGGAGAEKIAMWLLPKDQEKVEELWKNHYDEKYRKEGIHGQDLYKAFCPGLLRRHKTSSRGYWGCCAPVG